MFKNVKTVFFDYDGTLHDSIRIYSPAFRKAYDFLVSKGYGKEKEWCDKEIAYWLGFSSKDMWENFMPDLDEDIKHKASKIIGREMLNEISNGKAVLYEGAIETLKYLKDKGYEIVFISNCGISYRDMANEIFSLGDYFKEMACSEEYEYIPKYEILKKIKDKYPKDMVIVGDRHKDMIAGKKNNILTIGCSYGYGPKEELKDADTIIDDIRDIKEIL